MSYKIEYDKNVVKYLKKLSKSSPKEYFKIYYFLNEKLPFSKNASFLPNAKKLKGYTNHYRWRLGEYRIIGIVEKEEFKIIQIIKIDKKDDSTYKDLK